MNELEPLSTSLPEPALVKEVFTPVIVLLRVRVFVRLFTVMVAVLLIKLIGVASVAAPAPLARVIAEPSDGLVAKFKV